MRDAATARISRATIRSDILGRLALASLLVAMCGGGLLAAWLWPDAIRAGFDRLAGIARHSGPAGVLASGICFTAVAATGIIPGSLIGIAAGAFYGTWAGIPLAVACTMLGAALSFWLSRSVLRPVIAERVQRRARWRSFDTQIARDGWRLVALLRISPIMPFAATSFGLGLSSVAFAPYLLGTIAALPALCGLVALGSAAGDIGVARVAGFDAWRVTLLAVGGLATVVLSARIGRLLLRAPPDGPATDALGR